MNNTTFPFLNSTSLLNATEPTSLLNPLHDLKQTIPVTVVFTLTFSVIFLLSMLGNVLVCVVVVKDRSLRSVTNYFIVNLAVSDLLVTFLCMPVTLVGDILFGWRLGEVICRLTTLQGFSLAASIFTLVAIAGDRYRAVIHATAPKMKPWQACAIIGVIWMLAVTVMVPHAMVMQVQTFKSSDDVIIHVCTESWAAGGREAFTLAFFLLCFVLPLVIVSLLYVRISMRLGLRPSLRGYGEPRDASFSGKKVEVIKMLMIVVVLFALFWLPYHLVSLIIDFGALSPGQLRVVWVYAYPIVRWLGFCNSCMNPVVYGYCNKNFRKGFKAVFQGVRLGQQHVRLAGGPSVVTRSTMRTRATTAGIHLTVRNQSLTTANDMPDTNRINNVLTTEL